jgi:signal transduction histidine kinase
LHADDRAAAHTPLLSSSCFTAGPELFRADPHAMTAAALEEKGKDTGNRYSVEMTAYAIARLYQGLPSIITYLVFMPAVMAAVMWPYVEHALLLGWLLAAEGTYVARALLTRAFRRRQPSGVAVVRWAHYFTLTSVASGLVWAVAGFWFFVPGQVGHQVVLYTLIFALAAGSLIVTSYWPWSCYAFAVPSIGMVALRLVLEGSMAYYAFAALTILYLLILIRVAQITHRAAMDTVALRFENLDLVDQLRKQKNAAEQANMAKSKFLAAASHDLRQPLHALALFVAVLQGRIQYPEVREMVENISRSVSALDGLFQALLDISRLDAGIIKPKIVDFRLGALIDRLAMEYQVHAREKGLTLSFDSVDHVVRSDPALVEAILHNLLSNAIRYTPQGGVTLCCEPTDAGVRVDVLDTGIGIPEDKQREVFEEFLQLANPERDRSKGLGLGLAIVKRMAGLLGHRIDLRSQPAAGSCFSVVLPLGDPAAVVNIAPEPPPAAVVEALAGLNVVVIDDEAVIRIGMQIVLEGWGCTTVTASSVEEAIALLRFRQVTPGLIIADYRLREEHTGAHAIAQLQREFGTQIPGLIITGDTAPERLREAQLSGFALLHKPVQPAKLRAYLQRLMRGQLRADSVGH